MPVRLSIVAVVVAGLVLAGAASALAHTGLVESRPADGATIDQPLRRIELTFGGPIELTGEGAELLDASGTPVATSVTVDGADVTLRVDAPLPKGEYGVRWAIRSGDAHPVRDAITFTVSADPATGTAAAAGTPDRIDRAPPDGADVPAADRAGSGGADHAQNGTAERGAAADPDADGGGDAAVNADATATGGGTAALAAALTQDPTRWLRTTDVVLRAIFYAVAFGVIGTLAFLVTVWEGSRRELRTLTRMLARLAIAAVVVAGAQIAVRAARSAGGVDGALAELPAMFGGPYGTGVALRIAGAVIVLVGLPVLRRVLRRAATVPIAGGAIDVVPPPQRASADPWPSARQRWRAGALSVSGALLLVASFALVGHAATAPSRAVASVASAAHALAGGIWAGGLLALSSTLVHRRRAGVALRAGQVAVRFSVLATVGVLLATGAGVGLAAMRLDSVAALWTTRYGVALSAKIVVAAVVAGVGAYNHFAVVPVLRRTPDHPVGDRLRRLGLIEVTLMVVVLALTSALVSLGS